MTFLAVETKHRILINIIVKLGIVLEPSMLSTNIFRGLTFTLQFFHRKNKIWVGMEGTFRGNDVMTAGL